MVLFSSDPGPFRRNNLSPRDFTRSDLFIHAIQPSFPSELSILIIIQPALFSCSRVRSFSPPALIPRYVVMMSRPHAQTLSMDLIDYCRSHHSFSTPT